MCQCETVLNMVNGSYQLLKRSHFIYPFTLKISLANKNSIKCSPFVRPCDTIKAIRYSRLLDADILLLIGNGKREGRIFRDY